ncbi:MAG: hypothetical protein ACLPS1_02310 [Streptosporangiaceae bacterium]
MSPQQEAHQHADVLDEGLARLAVTGPEFRGGLSNHGPMAAEAMIRLGRPEAVEPWLDGYLPLLEEPPRASDRITDQTWPEAMGVPRRVTDWELYLRDQLADEPWQLVLARWWQRLVPGLAAHATHGIIRTSHAARSLAEVQTSERLHELGRGLAYWASGYLELPGGTGSGGGLTLDAAISQLPVAAGPVASGPITARIQASLAGEPDFAAAVSALRSPSDVPAGLLELATAFARVFLVYGRRQPIPFVHAVTAPVAARSVLGLLPGGVAQPSYDALWRTAAALYSAYAADSAPEPPLSEPPWPADLISRAVGTGDEHAIKFTEACLRLYSESADPILLQAAERACRLLG